MKTILSLLILVSVFSLTKAQAQSIPVSAYFDYTDTDGINHNLQDYFDQEKSVFVFKFDTAASSYQVFENLNLVDFYNTHGQGGNNDVIILCVALQGFDSYEDFSNLDFSNELGPGYENVSYTENNTIPMIITTSPVDTLGSTLFASLQMLCYDDNITFFYEGDSELYMNTLYDICCTSLETYDPGLELVYSSSADCNSLTAINYKLTNGTPNPFTSTDIGVWINGEFDSQFTLNQTVEGCTSVSLQYTSPNFSGGDEITLAIANSNTNTTNDTIHAFWQNMDTVSARIRIEIENLNGTSIYGYLEAYSDQISWTSVNSTNNYIGELYLSEGCHVLKSSIDNYSLESQFSGTVMITSITSTGSTADTLYSLSANINAGDSIQFPNILIYVNEAADPLITGYIYEDVNLTQVFKPMLPRIAEVEVVHGAFSSFSNANGYYELPLGNTSDPILIIYNEEIWPIITTSNPMNYQQYTSTYNFGLNQDDPVYGLQLLFNANLPVICASNLLQVLSIQNIGNQTTGGELAFTYDPLLTPISFSTEPESIVANLLTFQIPDLSINQSFDIYINYDALSAELIGEALQSGVDLWYEDENNNLVLAESYNSTDTVFCSYDPNDIYGFPLGSGDDGFIPENTDLDYRIRFQNTGNYPASTVVLVNTLPQELDWNSFKPLASSHDYLIQRNETTREIRWIFNNINLPDSSSDPLGSTGNVWYNIKMNDLNQGDQILNQAEIYFDSNLPIYTNISTHTIHGVTSVAKRENVEPIRISPNPAHETIRVKFAKQSDRVIEIYDLQGRKCVELRVNAEQANIPINHLEKGIYLISVIDDSEETQTGRFVKL